MQEVERARERLDNIRSVKPILDGLRTISLGSWQAALKRRSGVRNYAEQLKGMLPWLVPHLETRPGLVARLWESLATIRGGRRHDDVEEDSHPGRLKALVVGSERGLCGQFNLAVVEETAGYLRRESAQGSTVELLVLGSRAQRILERRGYALSEAGALSMTALPPLSLAFDLARQWLGAYEERDIDGADIIYNQYHGTGAYEPTVMRLIPPQIATDRALAEESAAESKGREGEKALDRGRSWPPPIIDTDPLSLYATVIEQSVAVELYRVLLTSAAAEHATRFQLMESATQNADRLIEELTLIIRTARRQEITQEMQELAAGAGLLGRE
jgi:F-type H+-transporting ATPase subunit gamma